MKKKNGLRVSGTAENSMAAEAGILAGDTLLAINGNEIRDSIDYEYFLAEDNLVLLFLDKAGEPYEVEIEGGGEEGFGLSFEDDGLNGKIVCRNKCVFCFVDQLPGGMRKTLYVKDDDWRMSFLMGSYITLTNLTEDEIARIIAQRISPLYISVHASDDDVRARLLGTQSARGAFGIVRRLAAAGISMHTQVVLCGGINDGDALQKTMEDLFALYPAVRSLAVVPVGLTCHREGLYPLKPLDEEAAKGAVAQIEGMQRGCLNKSGTRFVFGADELYFRAAMELPELAAYEEFPQIENGVGMVRKFLCEAREALDSYSGPAQEKSAAIATGADMAPFMRRIAGWAQERHDVRLRIYEVRNDFFGQTVTVAGLLTGRDLIGQLKGKVREGPLLLPATMFRENTETTLDGLALEDIARELRVPCRKVAVDGYSLIGQLMGEENGETTGSDCRQA